MFEEEWTIHPQGLSGGLSLWWDASIRVDVIHSSQNIINVKVQSTSVSTPDYVTCVYCPPKDKDKKTTWDQL